MSDSVLSSSGINFEAPAAFVNGLSGAPIAPGPHLLIDGTMDECIRQYLAKPPASWHLYEIHTSPQEPLVDAVISGEIASEMFSDRTAAALTPPLPKTDSIIRMCSKGF